jgi:integrase
LAIRKSNGRFVVEFEFQGDRVFRRLPAATTKAQAVEFETRSRQKLIDQKLLGKRPDVSLKKAIESWLGEVVGGRKSRDETSNHAAHVIREVGDCLVGAIAGQAAEAVRGANRQATEGEAGKPAPLSAGTINRRLCVLKAVAKFAWRKGWTEENLSAKIQLLPEKKYQRREVTPDMARLLIEKASTPRAKALIAFSAYTGLRLGEVLKLKPADIKGDALLLRDTKNGTDRVVPILPGLKPHLGQIPFGANWRNVYRGFERARERAGLEIRYHDLRHMVGTALHEAGQSQRTIMDIMGHKSIQTSARYIHPSKEANRRALAAALTKLDTSPSKSHQKGGKVAKKAA